MAIKAYVGSMGHGKTYEVVSVVILNALRQGRNVISNIAGLNYQEFVNLLLAEGVEKDKIGGLFLVTHEQVLKPDFWLTETRESNDDIPAYEQIQPGDLVALDEIWRFWNGFSLTGDDGSKRPPSVMKFFRMHRHFAHEDTGLTCEIALITQDVGDIHRSVKAVVEETYRMQKLTALGSTSRYRVDVFQKAKITRTPLRSLQRSYEAKYFPLYKSNSQQNENGAQAKEVNIDTRGNILSGKLFLLVLPVLLILSGFAFKFVWGFLHPEPKTPIATAPAPIGADTTQPVPVQAGPPEPLKSWRIVGYYQLNGSLTLVMRNDAGITRYVVNPPELRIAGLDIGALLGSEVFTNWSGAEQPQGRGVMQP